MKKLTILTISVFLSILFIFNACKKDTVKFGNKRIIGTWVLTAESSEYTYSYANTYSFLPVNDCYTDYVSQYKDTGLESYDGTSYTRNYYYVSTTDGEINYDGGNDTTYAITRTMEITFNEDGTCSILDDWKAVDENGEPVEEYMEITGNWNWLDAYEEKIGIDIVLTGRGGPSKAEQGPEGYFEMHLYFDVFEKDKISVKYDLQSLRNSEYTSLYSTCFNNATQALDDIYRKRIYSSVDNSSGTMEFEKREPEK